MRRSLRMFSIALSFGVSLAVLASSGCGKKDDDKDDDNSTSTSTGTGTGTGAKVTAVTASYTATCAIAGCHGSAGTDTPTGATAGHGVLKGTKLTEAQFKTAVRNGQATGMAAYNATVMSDADITTNYKFFTGQ